MRRLIVLFLSLTLFVLLAKFGLAEEAAKAAKESSTTEAIKESAQSLAADLKKARDIILEGSGGSPFSRGFLIALFQPVFLMSMLSLGLWAGQMDQRLRNIWMLPVVAFVATIAGAFITTYHTDWKPDLSNEKLAILKNLESTDAATIAIGVVVGGAVGMGFTVPAIFALAAAGTVGLILGFSQISEVGAHKNAMLPFWSGFGLMGLLINIFGLGFETFLESISLAMVTRWIGLATAGLSLAVGLKVL